MLGDIQADADQPQELAGRRAARLREGGEPPPLAIGTPEAGLPTEWFPAFDGAPVWSDVIRRIVGVNRRLPTAACHLFKRGAEEVPVGAVDEAIAAIGVGHPHDGRATVRHDAEPFFAFAQRVLGPFSLPDIFHVGDDIFRAAGAILQHRKPAARPHDSAGAVKVALLHLFASRWIG